MPANVEIKARVDDLDALREKAVALGAKSVGALRQIDTFYRVPRGRLKLRELQDGTGELIYYERPDRPGPKRSDYSIFRTPDPGELARVLAAAFEVRGVVEKRREILLVGQTRVHLDDVTGLGRFLELEVVLEPQQSPADGEHIAHGLLEALGVPAGSLASAAYVDLLEVRSPAPLPPPSAGAGPA